MEYGWLSLLPPLTAIILAIVTRRVLLSLGLAILVGAILLAWPERDQQPLVRGILDSAWNDHLWPALSKRDHLLVFLFSVTLGAMVGVIESAGGMESLVNKLTKRVRDRRGGQMMVWLLGLAIFFDDYANTLLLGSTMRSAADRLKFSRAKLAYLVDSTAAPVAGLALVSTWVATEISQIDKGLESAGANETVTAFSVFLASVPYRFYPILALVMVAVIAWSGRDFGPMWVEERKLFDPNLSSSSRKTKSAGQDALTVKEKALLVDTTGAPAWLWLTAVLPVLICVGIVCVFLVKTGLTNTGESELSGLRYWGEVVGNADSYISLVWGSAGGLIAALTMGAIGLRSFQQPRETSGLLWGLVRGAWQIMPAMLILWLAWSMSSMTDGPFLDTGNYIADLLGSAGMPGWLLPSAVFVTAGFVALSTGTSWGTMAILTPFSVKLAIVAGSQQVDGVLASDGGALLIPVVGAVLAGSIFGDHCSPISDTTVLSSRASGCDHVLHVRTQMPYAFAVALVSISLGTIPAGFGFSGWWLLLAGTVAVVCMVYFIGKPAETLEKLE